MLFEKSSFCLRPRGKMAAVYRRHLVQPTPMLDQLTRESQFWLQPRPQQEQQLTPLESHLLRHDLQPKLWLLVRLGQACLQ